jgi:hypothetical protein
MISALYDAGVWSKNSDEGPESGNGWTLGQQGRADFSRRGASLGSVKVFCVILGSPLGWGCVDRASESTG